MVDNQYGNFMQLKREKAGLTQAQVAESLKYSTPQFVSNVERGRCRFPIGKLPKIAKLYGMSRDEVIDVVISEQELKLRKVFRTKN